jgi:hypothetical protein
VRERELKIIEGDGKVQDAVKGLLVGGRID